jgi:DNA anti-recombination protein RmuC
MTGEIKNIVVAFKDASAKYLAANWKAMAMVFIGCLLLLFFLIGGFRSCSSTWGERQAEREKKIQQLEEQIDIHKQNAAIADEKIKLLEERNRELVENAAQLREAIASAKSERVVIREKYSTRRKEVDAITDAKELRRRNCADRKALGLDCP